MTDMSKIQPCPFCGYKFNQMDEDDFCYPYGREIQGRQLWVAGCIEHAGGCSAHVLGVSKEEAVEFWNRRVQ
jgi:hypothetical protein